MGISYAAVGLFGFIHLRICTAFVLKPAVAPQLTSWRCCNSHRTNLPRTRTRSTTDRLLCSAVRSSAKGDGAGQSVKRTSPAQQESDVFDWLAGNAGVQGKMVSLSVTKGGYRGLVANCDVEQGQVILEVPSDTCLWSTRDGVVSGLYGQTDLCWEAAGDLRDPVSDEDFSRGLTWDVRLALALMEATADPQIGGKFWDVYGRLLPQPHTVTVPFCLPQRLLTQLHNDGMATRAKKQVDRLHSIYPDLMQTLLSHPKTAVYAASAISKAVGGDRVGQGGGKQKGGGEGDIAPMALVWAFAMVRSRAFAAGDDRFSFVPFLDMANHDFAPSTNFTYEDPGVFRLRAMRDLQAGEEATIYYGENLNADQLMVQYGFPAPPTIPLARPLTDAGGLRDRVPATAQTGAAGGEGGEAATGSERDEQEEEEDVGVEQWGELQRRQLMDELFMCAQQRFAREAGGDDRQFETLVRRALPLIPPMAMTVGNLRADGGAVEGARAYLEKVEAYRSANFPSSEEQDGELLSYCLGEGKGVVDQRLADVVRYRMGRKEAHTMAAGILEEYLNPRPPPPTPMEEGEAGDEEVAAAEGGERVARRGE